MLPLVHVHMMFLFFFCPVITAERQEKAVIPREGICLGDGVLVVMVRVAGLERVPM